MSSIRDLITFGRELGNEGNDLLSCESSTQARIRDEREQEGHERRERKERGIVGRENDNLCEEQERPERRKQERERENEGRTNFSKGRARAEIMCTREGACRCS